MFQVLPYQWLVTVTSLLENDFTDTVRLQTRIQFQVQEYFFTPASETPWSCSANRALLSRFYQSQSSPESRETGSACPSCPGPVGSQSAPQSQSGQCGPASSLQLSFCLQCVQ